MIPHVPLGGVPVLINLLEGGNVMEEVRGLARNLNAYFFHIPRSANEVADNVAKEGVAPFISFKNGSL